MDSGLTSPQQISIWDRRMAEIASRESTPDHWLVEKVPELDIRYKRALDIGCGGGRHLVWLGQLGWIVTGLDWSPKAIAASKKSLDNAGVLGKLVKADFKRLPVSPSSFALVISTSTLHHGMLADFKRALMEIKKALKPGGYALMSLPTKDNQAASTPGTWIEDGTLIPGVGDEIGIPHHFFTVDEITKLARAFRKVEVQIAPANTGDAPDADDLPGKGGWFWVTLQN